MKKSLYLKALIAAVAVSASSLSFAQPIKMVGSDIVAEKISKDINERIQERSLDIKLNMLGTRQALVDLAKGDAQIAIIAIPEGEKKLEGYQLVPYAHQIAAVIVNTSNPIEEISIDQLRQIFGSDGAESVTTSWHNLGSGVDNTTVRNILPLASSLKESMALEIFKAKCLNHANVSLKVETKATTAELAQAIKTSSNAIGIGAYDPHLEGVKVLAVSDSARSTSNNFAFKPTSENVHNGDYPIRLDFYIAFKDENLPKIKPVLQILFDDSVLGSLEKGGLMPAPRTFVRSYLLGLDINQ